MDKSLDINSLVSVRQYSDFPDRAWGVALTLKVHRVLTVKYGDDEIMDWPPEISKTYGSLWRTRQEAIDAALEAELCTKEEVLKALITS